MGSPLSAQLLAPPTATPQSDKQSDAKPAATKETTSSGEASAIPPGSQPVASYSEMSRKALADASKALEQGEKRVAMQHYATALYFGKDDAAMADGLKKIRDQFVASGSTERQIEMMVGIYTQSIVANTAVPAATGSISDVAASPATPKPAAMQPMVIDRQLASAGGENPLRGNAASLAAQAKLALDQNDLPRARQLAMQAHQMNVPAAEFAPGQIQPWAVLQEVERREALSGQVVTAANQFMVAPADAVSDGVFVPQNDASRNRQAGNRYVTTQVPDTDEPGSQLFQKGIQALSDGQRDRALLLFRQAWQKQDELDPGTRTQLKDKLTLLQTPEPIQGQAMGTLGGGLSPNEQLQAQRLSMEVNGEIIDAEQLAVSDPLTALDRLKMLRERVSQAEVNGSIRKQNLTKVDRVLNNLQSFVDQNRAALEQSERNRQIKLDNEEAMANLNRVEAETKNLVDEYNKLVREKRFAEAEVVAESVRNLMPDSELAASMYQKAVIQRRSEDYNTIQNDKANNFVLAMNSVEKSSTAFNDEVPLQFTDAQEWETITRLRKASRPDEIEISPTRRHILEQLSRPVSMSCNGEPLRLVLEQLSSMQSFPILLDATGLAAEGMTGDEPVSLNLGGQAIHLKSLLTYALDPFNLVYDVRDDHMLITSRQTVRRDMVTRPYPVKDLVIPIPSFVTDYDSGLAGILRNAYMSQGRALLVNNPTISNGVGIAAQSSQYASVDPSLNVLGQMGFGPAGVGNPAMGGGMSGPMTGMPGMPFAGMGGNAGGMPAGGATAADFQQLMDLISSVIAPGEWEEDGGTNTMTPYPQNLSLIVNAPTEVQEQIRDLLAALRALQNLQVTIEVRFISLSDSFFERIGVDFDISIDDNVRELPFEDSGPSVTIGLDQAGLPTPDLDVKFDQGSFPISTPAFGNFSAGGGGTFGVAILSDIELFFLMEAAQGNTRSNVLQAPKVTMFDGQFASVNDFASRPFVLGLTPIVGDFAVAQQPIIAVLNDGTQLNVQSVVSPDRRFVRMTLQPNFTRIEDEDRTFTFEGSRTTRGGTNLFDPTGDPLNLRDDEETIVTGSTVQLPTLGQFSVNTTVTVPDGGTILMGGVKRMSEGRVERGVPIMSKIPYLNRLFKNTGIGRDSTSLMMTVTPRIIIPEEEEAAILGRPISP